MVRSFYFVVSSLFTWPMRILFVKVSHFRLKFIDSLFDYWNISFRLFSCGTSKEGESHLVEWNESEGAIKRTYSGFRKRSLGVVQFDTTRNRFLAAGDEFQIKFWDMDNTNMLTYSDGDGGLPVSAYDSSPAQIFVVIILYIL